MPGTDAMRAADRRRQSRSRLLSGRELTLAISATAWLAAPTGARAFGVPGTDYVLSNVSADFGGTRESISGIFTITANAGLEWYAKFNGALCGACLNGNIVHAIGITGNTIVTDAYQITFSSDFSSVIGIRSWTGDIGTDVTGGAVTVDSPLVYTFADASAVFGGTTETITGHFGFDPLTLVEYGANIDFTGGGPYAGNYFYDAELLGRGNFIRVEGPGGFLNIDFANNLSSGDDLLALVDGATSAPTGFVCPGVGPCAVPEPSGLAILGSALGLLFLGPWATRRVARQRAG